MALDERRSEPIYKTNATIKFEKAQSGRHEMVKSGEALVC